MGPQVQAKVNAHGCENGTPEERQEWCPSPKSCQLSFVQHSQIHIKSFSQTQFQKKGSSARTILTTLLVVNTCCQPEKEVVLAQSKTLYSFLISCLLGFETIGRKSRFSECEPNCKGSWCHFFSRQVLLTKEGS